MTKPWTADQEAALRANAHLGAEAVAKVLNRSVMAINTRASKLGVPLGRCDLRRRVIHPEGFMSNVEFDVNGGCWLWSAYVKECGYGVTTVSKREVSAHRLSWELYRGPIPDGMFVLHKCDVRACVNPEHLFLGTHADNMADMAAKGRALVGERNPIAKISAATAAQVVDLLRSGIGPTEAARRIGCSKYIARNIAYGGSWRSISQPEIA